KFKNISVILSGGKGKRIKSEIPKVLHALWGIPSVVRVSQAAKKGLNSPNQVVVVGMKAQDVAALLGDTPHTIFAYQEVQKGTGHALQVAVSKIKGGQGSKNNIFVFPGDAGLLDAEIVAKFRRRFEKSSCSAMMLTGAYEGPVELNMYGRIVRIPDRDSKGNQSGDDFQKVAEIMQAKDIIKMLPDEIHKVIYNKKEYHFTRQQLLENREFDSGMIAFRYDLLKKYLGKIKSDNVQKELYMTDLVKIFNAAGHKVESFEIKKDTKDSGFQHADALLGFNSRSELKKMESILRAKYFELLKDIITFEDEEDFFLDLEVVKRIQHLDSRGIPLDITIGEGCFVGKGVKINKGLSIGKRAILEGNIIFGQRVKIGENVHLSAYPRQKMHIGDDTVIFDGDIIKGNVKIGNKVRIETGVTITGSDEYPVKIGDNCTIKGTTYIFGSIVEPDNCIQHSVLVHQLVQRIINKSGLAQKVKYILPLPEGRDSIKPLSEKK
ncbi:MAG: NTP transferase domain-containing protein, partial [Elusimicrobia bacterium]|nr:NTP transferase domain-containing protein [Elusimicrobiota bacterium]